MTSIVRLAVTKNGIGVRATAPIAKGQLVRIWEPGDMIYIPLEAVRDIEYLKWLNVFGIIAWQGFFAPPNPNRMSLAWYINHSSKPNLTITVSPAKWTIRARRSIKAGEELTVDYGTLDFHPSLNRGKKS